LILEMSDGRLVATLFLTVVRWMEGIGLRSTI